MLVSKDGCIKCADFGVARTFGKPGEMMTKAVCTRWYKAPEIIYGTQEYGSAIDVWSLGCIFAELFLRRPLFPGMSDIDQLSKIVSVMGRPDVSECFNEE